jgi:Ca2+-transporting ATPase
VKVSLALHACVIYVSFLQQAFCTSALTLSEWLVCTAVASSVLWARELGKSVTRAMDGTSASRKISRELT